MAQKPWMVVMLKYFGFLTLSVLLFQVPLGHGATLEEVMGDWSSEYPFGLEISSSKIDPKTELSLRTINKRRYWDTKDVKISEDEIQNFISLKWDSQTNGMSFIDFKKALYQNYHFDLKKFRYNFPYPVLNGWWGLNHPPIKNLEAPLSNYHPIYKNPKKEREHPFYDEDFQKNIDQQTFTELTFGNDLKLLKNKDSYAKKLELIRSAQKSIWITVMTFSCDESSSDLLEELVKKRKQGLEVKLIVEGLWTKLILNKCLKRMRANDLEVMTLFESIKPETFSHLTHSKFWIFDHHRAILGGQNIMDSENTGTGFNEGARDTEVYIKGPIVTDLSLTFAQTWQKNRKKSDASLAASIEQFQKLKELERLSAMRGQDHYKTVLTNPSLKDKGVCRVLSQDPGSENSTITRALVEYTKHTDEYLFVTSPKSSYNQKKKFSEYPAGAIFQEMLNAAKRNVRVDYITNGIDALGGDATEITRHAANKARSEGKLSLEKTYRNLSDTIAMAWMGKKLLRGAQHLATLDPQLHVWNYFRFAHQKVHYFDRILVGIGSFNLDKHSARGNRETELFCLDVGLTSEVDQMLVLDLSNSVPL